MPILTLLLACCAADAPDWPALPDRNGVVQIPAQPWPLRPGPRRVRVKISYPDRSLDGVNERTGVMLTLHNWGGEDCAGTANPDALAQRLNVVAICVNYLQSGRKASIQDPEPYDFGYLQSLDALRALWFVCDGLRRGDHPYDHGRLYCTGGSGGGNVTLMANKLAPRTFACVIDMCGMKKLSHDVAFKLPGGSGLNARWSRDPASPNYLSHDHQELRFVGHPQHLQTSKSLGSVTKIVVVHGVDDTTCPYADAVEMVANMRAAGLDVEPRFLNKSDLDGKVFTSTGHPLGNRTEIVFRVAGHYLKTDSPELRRRRTPSDFQRRDEVRYQTSNGQFVISYKQGYPVARFEPASPPPDYPEHHELSYYLGRDGQRKPVQTPADWDIRRRHTLEHLQRVMGRMPSEADRAPLDVRVLEETRDGQLVRRKISFQSDAFDRVNAWLLLPATPDDRAVGEKQAVGERRVAGERRAGEKAGAKHPAMLCLHQTTKAGKDEPVGLAGSKNMHYAIELARRGYVTLSPDYPSLGEHTYDFAAHPEYASGTMKAIWDNIRAVDLLASIPEVDAGRIGVLGHSLGGHNAMFTAAFEPRLKVIVSSCGFSSLVKDDLPSWSGPRYMPRIASVFNNKLGRLPFDFSEIVAGFAPRPFLAVAATRDTDFDVSGVRDVIQSAGPIYKLFEKSEHLQAFYSDGPHDFPLDARKRAYEFLDQHLQPR